MKFASEDIFFIGALVMVYTPSCLVKVSIEDGREKFLVEIPSCDLDILQTDYNSPEGLGISSVKHYGKTISLLSRMVSSMKESYNLWINKSWIESWVVSDSKRLED
jgi:hypothetical protein